MTTRRRITMERIFSASLEAVWQLWTTKEGVESWLGPDGFLVKVHEIDVRPGGTMRYSMIAAAAPQVEFMKKSGMSLTTEAKLRYVEVEPLVRLAYAHLADFIPGVAPYDVATRVEFFRSGESVRMALTFDAMHDDHWTRMAEQGWQSCLGKMSRSLEPQPAVVPFLWFNTEAEGAARHYTSIFPNARLGEITHFPAGGRGSEGSVMTVSFRLGGLELVALNGNRRHTFSPAVSLLFKCATQEEADTVTDKLAEGGERQPGGWLKDKYGVSWQVAVR